MQTFDNLTTLATSGSGLKGFGLKTKLGSESADDHFVMETLMVCSTNQPIFTLNVRNFLGNNN
jgi:hypothetical protein